MTSSGLADFKDLLVATRDREREIKEDMRRARRQLMWSSVARGLAILTFASTLSKPVRDKTSNALALRRSDLATLEGNLKASTISISFDMETDIAAPHSEMISAFEQLRVSQRSWSVETSQHIDRVKARSVAGIVISRVSTILQRRADPLISTDDLPLAVDIQRGKSTAFFYPGFLLIVEKATREFGVIDIKDVELVHGSTRFTETERVPSDATMVGRAWAKSNKDGSRDRRFRDNRELPVMLYGEMSMQAVGGLNETMMFSDHDACQRFTAAVSYLKRVLAAQTGRRGVGAGRKAIPRTHQP